MLQVLGRRCEEAVGVEAPPYIIEPKHDGFAEARRFRTQHRRACDTTSAPRENTFWHFRLFKM